MAILKNFFLEMFKGENKKFVYLAGDVPKDYTRETQQAIDAKKEQTKLRQDLDDEFNQITQKFEELKVRGTSEQEKQVIEDMMRRLIDEQLQTRVDHLEVKDTKVLPKIEVLGHFLDQIAEDNGMTLEGLLALNPENENFHISSSKTGRLYCLENDRVIVKLNSTELATRRAQVDQFTAGLDRQAEDQRDEDQTLAQQAEAAETTDDQQWQRQMETYATPEQLQDLNSHKWEVPEVLRTGNNDKWASYFEKLDTNSGAGLRNAREIIMAAESPFNWRSLNDFRTVLQEGGFLGIGSKTVLKFDDIITFGHLTGVTATNGKDFMTEYAQLKDPKYMESLSKEKTASGKQLISINAETKAFTKIEKNTGALKLGSLEPKIQAALIRNPGETLAQWQTRVTKLKGTLIAAKGPYAEGSKSFAQLTKAEMVCTDAITEIRSMRTKFDTAKSNYKEDAKNLQDAIDKKARYEKIITSSLALFDALGRLTQGEEQVEVDTEHLDESSYSEPERDALALMNEAFEGRDLNTTEYAQEAGEGKHNPRGTSEATKRYTIQEITDDMLSRHTSSYTAGETSRRVIDTEGMKQDLESLLIIGLEHYSLDADIDLVAIAEEFEVDLNLDTATSGINLVEKIKEDKKNLKKATREGNQSLIDRIQADLDTLNQEVINRLKTSDKFKTLTLGDISESQKQLIQLGYLQRRNVEIGEQTVQAKEDIRNRYGEQIASVLTQIEAEAKGNLTPTDLETIAESIKTAMEQGLSMPTAAAIEAAAASAQATPEGVKTFKVGGITFIANNEGIQNIIPTILIPLPKGLGTIDLSLNIKPCQPITLNNLLAGWTGSQKLLDTALFDITGTLRFSLLGASVGGMATFGKEAGLQLSVGGGVGTTWTLIPSWYGGVRIGDNAEASVKENINREMTKQQLKDIPPPDEDKNGAIAAMRGIPLFQRAIKDIPSENIALQEEVLLTTYNVATQSAKLSGTDKFLFPVRDVVFGFAKWEAVLKVLFPNREPPKLLKGLIEKIPGGIPAVCVTFAIGGGKIVPFISKDHLQTALRTYTDARVEAMTMERLADRSRTLSAGNLIDIASSTAVEIDPVTGEVKPQYRDLNIDLGRDLREYNDVFSKTGIRLEKDDRISKGGYAEYQDKAYRLAFAKNRFLGTVELHIDGQTEPKTHIITGNPQDPNAPTTLNDLYLAFDSMQGGLYITVEELNTAPDRYGNTTRTIITIKTNPFRTRSEIEAMEAANLEFSANESVKENRTGRTTEDNILRWSELRGSTHEREIRSMETTDAYTARVLASHERMQQALHVTKGPIESVDPAKMDGIINRYLTDGARFKKFSTIQIDSAGNLTGINYKAIKNDIETFATAEGIPVPLSQASLNYVMNRLVVESFHKYRNTESLRRTIDHFFRPQIATMIAATDALKAIPEPDRTLTAERFSNTIISQLGYDQILERGLENIAPTAGISPDTYMLTIVGTNGVVGLRGMLNLGEEAGNILNASNIIDNIPTVGERELFRKAVLELASGVPEKTTDYSEAKEFLDCPLAIKCAELAPILLGPDASDKLAALHGLDQEQLTLMLRQESWKDVYDKFRELVDTFRSMQTLGEGLMTWESMDGHYYAIKDLSTYQVGVYKKCANPGLLIHEGFAIARLKAADLVEARALQETQFESARNLWELGAGLAGYMLGTPQPPASKESPSRADGTVDPEEATPPILEFDPKHAPHIDINTGSDDQ